MRTIMKWALSTVSLALCVTSALAWAFMFRGEPWMPTRAQHRGVATVAYGTSAKSIELTLNGDGIRFSRNPSSRSYEPADTQQKWTAEHQAQPEWDSCGTGKDDYVIKSEIIKAGLHFRKGLWQRSWGLVSTDANGVAQVSPSDIRPHFTLRLPHWLLVAITAILPLAHVVSIVRARLSRRKEGCCRACGYDLTGNVSGTCSECGRPLDPPLAPMAIGS